MCKHLINVHYKKLKQNFNVYTELLGSVYVRQNRGYIGENKVSFYVLQIKHLSQAQLCVTIYILSLIHI